MKFKPVLACVCLFCFRAMAVEVVSSNVDPVCETFPLSSGLTIYKDPSPFLPEFARLHNNDAESLVDLLTEDPVLTTRVSEVSLMKLTEPSKFRHFGFVAKLYGMKDRRLKKGQWTEIIHVRLCGNDPYADTLGFVLVEDLQVATSPVKSRGLPPSVKMN